MFGVCILHMGVYEACLCTCSSACRCGFPKDDGRKTLCLKLLCHLELENTMRTDYQVGKAKANLPLNLCPEQVPGRPKPGSGPSLGTKDVALVS